MNSKKDKDTGVLLSCIVVGVVVGFVSFFLIARAVTPNIRATEGILDSLLTITVQLFGFGGVIFSVLYLEQRKVIGEHRAATNRVYHNVKENDTIAPPNQKIPSTKERLSQIRKHLEPYIEATRIYLEVKNMFSLGFLTLGTGLLFQLVQRVGIGAVAKISSVSGFLISVDLALIAIGISSFIAALRASLGRLPLGTNVESDLLGEMKELNQRIESLIHTLEKG